MTFLPPRPLALQQSFLLKSYLWGVLWLLVGLAVGGAYVVWQVDSARRIVRDQEVWANGTPSEFGNVHGSVRSHYGIFKEYSLEVSYTDTTGGQHYDRFSFDTFGGGVDDDTQPTLRYDARNPAMYAISWAVECTGSRWASVIFMMVVGSLIGLGIGAIGFMLVKRARDSAAIARESEEVECTLVSAVEQYVNGRPNGNMVYTFRIPALPPLPSSEAGYRNAALAEQTATVAVDRTVVMPRKKGEPFFTQRGAAGDKILVLVSRADTKRFIVPRYDLYPLALTEEQRAAALAKAAA
jgi:hypothetical protein